MGSEPIMDPFHLQSQNADAFARQHDPFNQPSSILTDHVGSVIQHESSGVMNENNQSVINSLARHPITSIEKRESHHFTRDSMLSKQNGLALTYTETENQTVGGRDSLGNKYDLPFMPANIHQSGGYPMMYQVHSITSIPQASNDDSNIKSYPSQRERDLTSVTILSSPMNP